ncbi:MAG: hypothetical protein NTY20_05295 [Candidatus Aenigmarchaeota archaeon]|nr:hypothetical protein [Candidatus Aenigmarchaeota archaeon]
MRFKKWIAAGSIALAAAGIGQEIISKKSAHELDEARLEREKAEQDYDYIKSKMEESEVMAGILRDIYEDIKKSSLGKSDSDPFERNPAEWKTLPIPEGSYREGSGKSYKVIVEKPFFVREDGEICICLKQDGYFDAIAVSTKAGVSFGLPGKEIGVIISPEELFDLLEGRRVPFSVMGIEQGVYGLKVKGSYRGEFSNPFISDDKPLKEYRDDSLNIG